MHMVKLSKIIALIIATLISMPAKIYADTETSTFATDPSFNDLVVSDDGSIIAYTDQNTNKVHFLDSNLQLIRSSAVLMDPDRIVIDSTNTYAYVGSRNGQKISTVTIADGSAVVTSTTSWNNRCLEMLPGGTHLLSCEGVNLVKRAVTDLQTGSSSHTMASFGTVTLSAQSNTDASRIYVSESGGHVTVLDSSLNTVDTFTSPNWFNTFVFLSPATDMLAVTDFTSLTTKIINALTGATITTLNLAATQFSPDGTMLYGIGGTGAAYLVAYRVPTWELVKQTSFPNPSSMTYKFSPSGDTLYAHSSSPDLIHEFAVSPALVMESVAANSNTNSITFVLSANEDIDCATLSASIGIDFDAIGITSIDSITQTSTDECTIAVTASAVAGQSSITAQLTPAITFSLTGASSVVSDMFGLATQSSTNVLIPGSTTTSSTSTTTTSSTSTEVSTTTIASGESLPPTGSRSDHSIIMALVLILSGFTLVLALTSRSRFYLISPRTKGNQ